MILLIIFFISYILYVHIYIQKTMVIHQSNKPLKIPRNIIQLIKDKNDIHPEFKDNINYIKKLNPGWNYILMDDKDILKYLKQKHPKYLPFYLAINQKIGASRADFFRYIIMYDIGGIYLDIKSAMSRPLDTIISSDDEYILSYWLSRASYWRLDNDYGEFQQWHIICIPKHPVIKKVIENVIKNIYNYDKEIHDIGKLGVLNVTGPIMYTNTIKPYLDRYKFSINFSHKQLGLIYDNKNHKKIFGENHYRNISEPVVLSKENLPHPRDVIQSDIIHVKFSRCSDILSVQNNRLKSIITNGDMYDINIDIIDIDDEYSNKIQKMLSNEDSLCLISDSSDLDKSILFLRKISISDKLKNIIVYKPVGFYQEIFLYIFGYMKIRSSVIDNKEVDIYTRKLYT